MKILIITLHKIINNYGSVLQGFALCEFLINNGYDAQVIDYCPEYKTNKMKAMRDLAVKSLFFPCYLRRTRKFQNFIANNNKLTQIQYSSYEKLLSSPPEADIYIAGSDQIWNSTFPCGTDDAYFLKFVKLGEKMSYAASLGRDDIPTEELLKLKEKIKDFKCVLVREKSGMAQLKKVGVGNVQCVADPVLLLSKENYIKLIENHGKIIRTKYKKYLLVYAVEQSDLFSSTVRKISNELDLKVISIGGFSNKCKCNKFFRSAGPEDFLSLIANANFIVTSSFHCVAFCLIFKKNFAIILPSKNPTRIENIISIVGLECRIVKKSNSINSMLKTINYTEPSKYLDLHIKLSKKYLIDNLETL